MKWKRTVMARLWIKDLRRVVDGNKAAKEKQNKRGIITLEFISLSDPVSLSKSVSQTVSAMMTSSLPRIPRCSARLDWTTQIDACGEVVINFVNKTRSSISGFIYIIIVVLSECQKGVKVQPTILCILVSRVCMSHSLTHTVCVRECV